MSDLETNLAPLLHLLHDVFDGSDAEPVRNILTGWPAQPRSITAPSARTLPVTQWLPEARKHATEDMGAVVQTLSDVSATLWWQQTYSDADMDRFFSGPVRMDDAGWP